MNSSRGGRWRRSILAAMVLLAPAIARCAPIELSDDRGRRFTLEQPARRIVTLAPHLAELAFAAGAGRALAGVSSASDFPEAAQRLPVVASHGRADAEQIASIRPDLVLAWLSGTPVQEVERLERMGLRVFVTEVRMLEDIPRLVRVAGRLAGTVAEAGRVAASLDAGIAALAPSRRPDKAVPTFVEIWHSPLLTVNGAHLISDVLRRCGGANVFERAPSLTFAVSREQLLAARPEAIIMNAAPGEEEADARRRWSDALLPAVRRGQLYAVDPREMHSQGPRLLQVARALCRSLSQDRPVSAPDGAGRVGS